MNSNLTTVFQIIITILSIANIILIILFLTTYLNYCSYKSLIEDLKKETHKSNEYELLEYTDIFCRYEEGTEVGRIWGHFFLIAFNAVHLGSLVTAMISSLSGTCNQKKCGLLVALIFFFSSAIIPLIDFFIGVAQSDSLSENYYSNFSQSFIDELNKELNSVKNKKKMLMIFSGVATLCSIICGILSSILYTQFDDVQMGHVNYPTYAYTQNMP